MRNFTIAATVMLALTACESKFDTCVTDETAAAQEALQLADPVYQAYARMEKHEEKLEDYYRALHTKRMELESWPGPQDKKCDMAPTSDCTQAQEKLYATLTAHLEAAGFTDIENGINALWDAQDKHVSEEALEKVMAAGDAAAGTSPAEDDIEGWVTHDLAAYRGERDYHLNEIVLPRVAAAAAQQATQLCSSRGK